MNKDFDEIVWLQDYIGDSFSKKRLENVRNFVFFWSLFEGVVCNNNANVDEICRKVDTVIKQGNVSIVDFEEFLQYFQSRYVTSGNVNHQFESLSFRGNDKKELVKEVLEGKAKDISNIIKALLIVVFRLRNNLFHGKKKMETLETQIDNFRITNKLLR